MPFLLLPWTEPSESGEDGKTQGCEQVAVNVSLFSFLLL